MAWDAAVLRSPLQAAAGRVAHSENFPMWARSFEWKQPKPGRKGPKKHLFLCRRCRGLVVGWNRKYMTHQLLCLGKLGESVRVSIYAIVAALVFILPAASAVTLYDPVAAGLYPKIEADLVALAASGPEALVPDVLPEWTRSVSPPPPVALIVIDPGHGGLDAGSTGPSGLTEKELVLDIANRLRASIEAELGAEVVLTRDDDSYVPLESRTAIANRANADLFISIHANASLRQTSRGFETYFLGSPENRTRGASREFATHIQAALASTIPYGEDRGVKSAALAVLNGARMPSTLAEVSFLSNPEDERLLKGEAYRQQIADALLEGVRSYSKTLDAYTRAQASD